MSKNRLEAFSDGVLAIIITIMVLELKVPRGADLAALLPLGPVFLGYLLSFAYVAIYWNNHHHLMHAARQVDGGVLWSNLVLLFWLSLLPFATGWWGENPSARVPAATYGAVLLACALSWLLLQGQLVRLHGRDSPLARVLGTDLKGKISFLLYLLGIGAAFVHPWISTAIYASVALIWIVPDRRYARAARTAPAE